MYPRCVFKVTLVTDQQRYREVSFCIRGAPNKSRINNIFWFYIFFVYKQAREHGFTGLWYYNSCSMNMFWMQWPLHNIYIYICILCSYDFSNSKIALVFWFWGQSILFGMFESENASWTCDGRPTKSTLKQNRSYPMCVDEHMYIYIYTPAFVPTQHQSSSINVTHSFYRFDISISSHSISLSQSINMLLNRAVFA